MNVIMLSIGLVVSSVMASGDIVEEMFPTSPSMRSSSINLRQDDQDAVRFAYANARRGAMTYFAGLVIDLAVATPLSIAAVVNQDEGLLLASLGLGLVSTGMKIGGPIRCGVGGTMAYEAVSTAGIDVDRPRHWGFYQAGWAFVAGSALFNLITNVSGEPTMALASMGCSIAGDVMWITSCVKSHNYAKKMKTDAGIASLKIQPYFAANDAKGLLVTYKF